MAKTYKHRKRGAGRHVQLSEYLQSTEAWAQMKPGPRALYIAIKRRYNGYNNGRISISHEEAAKEICVSRNTIGPYFKTLIERGFVRVTQKGYLGPEGNGRASLYALTEVQTADKKPATREFARWKKQTPRAKSVRDRPKNCD